MTNDEKRKRVAEIQARAARPGAADGQGLHAYGSLAEAWTRFTAHARSDVPWLCEELLKVLDASKPLVVADSWGRNPEGPVRLLPDPDRPWIPLVED